VEVAFNALRQILDGLGLDPAAAAESDRAERIARFALSAVTLTLPPLLLESMNCRSVTALVSDVAPLRLA
jgi:hypothetical protein